MNKRILLAILALTLCVGAFLFPIQAHAASGEDTTPPTVRAWINGDTLHVEASDDGSGVEAAFIDGSRINYRVDGAFDVVLRDYAGNGEYISIYVVDFAGNKSDTVQLKNPYYTAPAFTSAPSSTPAATRATASTSSSAPTEAPAETEQTEAIPFTPNGTGTVVDNVTEQNGKEFFTITTDEGNVFYLVIDRQRDSDNVYLLNTVTEEDLIALAEKSGSTIQNITPDPEPIPQETEPEPTPEPESEAEPETGGGRGSIIFIIIAAIVAGGAGYYFKILKPKRQASDMDDDYDGDDEDYDDEPDYSGDSDDDYSSDDPDDGE